IGVVEHQLEELAVLVGQPLVDLLLLVLPLALLLEEEHEDGEGQAEDRHQVAAEFEPLEPGHCRKPTRPERRRRTACPTAARPVSPGKRRSPGGRHAPCALPCRFPARPVRRRSFRAPPPIRASRPGGAHPRASCARGTPFLSNMPTLTHASVLLTLLASSLCAQRGRATLQHAGLESSIDHGQPLWGKHTLESLPVGQQWRLGNESATCWRTAVPLIQGDVLIAPGAYRVALSRRGEQSFTVDFASAAMAFGGNGTPGFAAKLVPGKHEV